MVDISITLPNEFLKEEVREGYLVSKKIKELWAIQLDLLSQVVTLCKKYNIQYFLCGGTLLGAIRHKGFIPWDDDLDIMMTRNNFNRFCQIAEKELLYPYFIQTEKTDPGCLYRFAKIRNCMTTGIENKPYYQNNKRINQGIFIDVFCLDKIPDNTTEREKYFNELYKIWGKVWKIGAYESHYIHFSIWDDFKMQVKLLMMKLTNKRNYYNDKFEKLAAKYKDDETKECCHIAGALRKGTVVDSRYLWSCKDYIYFKEANFEFMKLSIPVEYEKQLDSLYGDWHKPVMGQNSHGELIIDTEKSYNHKDRTM